MFVLMDSFSHLYQNLYIHVMNMADKKARAYMRKYHSYAKYNIFQKVSGPKHIELFYNRLWLMNNKIFTFLFCIIFLGQNVEFLVEYLDQFFFIW